MTHARLRLAAVLAALILAVTACASNESTPVISDAPAPPAPAVIPADWTETSVPVAGSDATYTAPKSPGGRLRVALVLGGDDRAGDVATRELVVMLAHQGVASLRYTGALTGRPAYSEALDRAGRALTALADVSKADDDRILAVGHGAAVPLAVAVGAGDTGRAPRPVGLIEPALGDPLPGAPDVTRTALELTSAQSENLGKRKHNIITCSDVDVAVDCSAVQSLADMLTGTHVNFVRLRGVSHALQEDGSRDAERYGATDLPYSAALNRSLATWVSMQ